MIAAIIQARMSSKRLPGKVLMEVNGRSLLSYMIERVSVAKNIDQIIVATSTEKSDDPIAEFCEKEQVKCYRGSLDDVLDRYYQAALLVKSDIVIRLTADCPLIDPQVIDSVINIYQDRGCDYVANTCPSDGFTFPEGMDVEVFSFKALKKAWLETKKPSEREHVTFYFWQSPQRFSSFRYDLDEDLSHYRLTVDYPQDFEVIKSIITGLFPCNRFFTMKDIICFLDAHPEVKYRNQNIKSNQGWQSAFEKDKRAGL